jgi:hypothetical protein
MAANNAVDQRSKRTGLYIEKTGILSKRAHYLGTVYLQRNYAE